MPATAEPRTEAYLCMYVETGLKLGYGGLVKESETDFGLLREWELSPFPYQSMVGGDGQHILSCVHGFSMAPLTPVSTELKEDVLV